MRHVEIYLNVTLGHAFLGYEEGDEMRCAWRGYLDLPDDDHQANAIVWAYFQNPLGFAVESRQDQAWIERAQELTKGYRDRSLSAGDVVTIDDKSYAVELIGWKPVPTLTGDEIVGPEGDIRLRQQAEAVENASVSDKCPVCGNDSLTIDAMQVSCSNDFCGFRVGGGLPEGLTGGPNPDA